MTSDVVFREDEKGFGKNFEKSLFEEMESLHQTSLKENNAKDCAPLMPLGYQQDNPKALNRDTAQPAAEYQPRMCSSKKEKSLVGVANVASILLHLL